VERLLEAFAFLAARAKLPTDDPLVVRINATMSNIGVYIIAIAILHLCYVYISEFLAQQAKRRANKIRYIDTSKLDTQKRSFIPKYWQMSRCRPGVRMTCPNFLDRVPCWKRRSGCFCDRDLANFLISATDRKDAQEAIDIQRIANSPGMVHMRDKMKMRRRGWGQQKKLCHECPLYNEHQEYKYKNLSWISFPITAGITVALYGIFHVVYLAGTKFLDEFMARLVKTGSLPENFHPDASSLVNSPFEYVLLAVLGLLLASYVIVLTEKCFLSWKL
jgi:hypothetical protein